MKTLVWVRRLSQTFFTLLFVYILWSTTYPMTGLLPPETFFQINPLIMIFASISERLILPGILWAGLMLALTLILGRFFCGWVCPLGASIDLVAFFRKKKNRLSDSTNRKTRKPKFIILGTVALFALFGIQIAWILDPMVIMARFVSLNLIPSITLGLNWLFQTTIQTWNLYGPVYDFYRNLKSSFLGVHIYFFAHTGIIFAFFVTILLLAAFLPRLWCRAICPLGAIYALTARPASLKRCVSEDCIQCGLCKSDCRMGAIRNDISYTKGECILCMDCVYDCPKDATSFKWDLGSSSPLKIRGAGGVMKTGHNPSSPQGTGGKGEVEEKKQNISRKDFLLLLSTGLLSLSFKWKQFGRSRPKSSVIRPPAVTNEEKFVNQCIRCGNCMKVCPTNVLQPTTGESGLGGIWTPRLVPEIGYCEYNCNLCGTVCPTEAIPHISLVEKKKAKLGLARVHQNICIAWADKKQCIVCEEHCPVPTKAIKLIKEELSSRTIYKPYVDDDLCIGCGICQNKCPVRPFRAIRVYPL